MTRREPEGYTIGLGLTDRCSANCPQCYSRPRGEYRELDYEGVVRFVEGAPIHSINFGTGESILYPRFVEMVRTFAGLGITLAVTTNGSTVQNLSDADLILFHDIDFSLDFADERSNDSWRGLGSYGMVMRGIERCKTLGVETSLVTCLMKQNCAEIGKLAGLVARLDLSLRVNIYKSVFSREYQPGYDEFWTAIRELSQEAYFTACSEPIVSAAIGHHGGHKGSPCGQMSFRIHPDGKAVACVYLRSAEVDLGQLTTDFGSATRAISRGLELELPRICRDCPHLDDCRGGCQSRRLLNHADQPDEYCFVARGDQPQIQARWKQGKDLVHENYLCTLIFSG